MVSTDVVSKHIDKFGETVTIRVKGTKTYSNYGDVMELSSEVTSKAVYNVYTQLNQSNEEGYFKLGDKTFFFKSSETNLANGNVIIRADESEYEIEDILDPGLYGSAYVYEAKVNRI